MSKIGSRIKAAANAIPDPVGTILTGRTGSENVLGKTPTDGGGGGGGGGAAPAASDTRRTDEELSSQVAIRDAILTSQARAAGAVRTENEADLLGSGPPTKRRAASRRLLG